MGKAQSHNCPATFLTNPTNYDILNYHKNLALLETCLNTGGDLQDTVYLFKKLCVIQPPDTVICILTQLLYTMLKKCCLPQRRL